MINSSRVGVVVVVFVAWKHGKMRSSFRDERKIKFNSNVIWMSSLKKEEELCCAAIE